MYLPEFSITNKILNLVAEIEKSRSLIENTFILPFSRDSLRKESKEKKIYNLLLLEDFDITDTDIKRHLDSISPHLNSDILQVIDTLEHIEYLSKKRDSFENKVFTINSSLTNENVLYRTLKIPGRVMPEEILASLKFFYQFLESTDASEIHPLLVSGIIYAYFEKIIPFQNYSSLTASLASEIYLFSKGYQLIEIIPYQENFYLNRFKQNEIISNLCEIEDFTEWLEFFLYSVSFQLTYIKEKFQLLSKQSKDSQVSHIEKLTPRQKKLYQYLLDYKFIQNSQFPLLFPEISEDSILRDLKVLKDLNLVVKTGKTKSSKYELFE